MSRRFLLRACAFLFSLAMIGVASTAFAHVTVSSPDAESGGFGKLVFRVPTEVDDAATKKISVSLPEKTPFAFVNAQSKPGWKMTMTKIKHKEPIKVGDFNLTESVSQVIWTATDGGIGPHEFDEFALSVGPFADVKSLTFSADQTYSDGTVVKWDEKSDGGDEPEHPAPTLTLAKPDAHKTSAVETNTQSSKENHDDDSDRTLGIIAIVVAAGALGVSAFALRRKHSDA